MKHFIKNIYLNLLLVVVFLIGSESYSKGTNVEYSKETISNYFTGIISARQDNTKKAFKHLNKIQSIKKTHDNFSIEFIRTLVLLEKFDQAFSFAKSISHENGSFFEANLLLGIESFINEDYVEAEEYFEKLNNNTSYRFIFQDFLTNILLSWSQASQKNKEGSFYYLDQITRSHYNLKKIQTSFLHCFYDSPNTETYFNQLINDKEYVFSRYNFFLVNYLLFKNQKEKARKLITESRKLYGSNILLKQTENFILTGKSKKIQNLFSCKNPKDNIAEIFYVIGNLYATQMNYNLSNFFLKISLLLNDKFKPNEALLGENFFYQEQYELAKNIYSSINSVGPIYSWYAARSRAAILLDTLDADSAIYSLKNDFNSLSNPNFEHYYDMANFYKDNEYYKESIQYYSMALKEINKDHFLFPKILDRRGTSYERLGEWQKAEIDLKRSLDIIPDQPFVLNYLAYSWIEKRVNTKSAIEMLIKANELEKDNGYIMDSLGWAYFVNKNYTKAEENLRRAVELMPFDPVINDHYADTLWMLNKNIQARYIWKSVLNLKNVEEKLKENINKKLVFGLDK